MKIFVAHSSDFDFENKLYRPIRASDLNTAHEIILPQEAGYIQVNKEIIQELDVLIVDVSKPSLGAGIEIGWADALGIPIIAIFEKGSRVSASIDDLIKIKIEYQNAHDMITSITEALEKSTIQNK